MASVAVQSKSGDVETVTPESFPAWKRRVGKDAGFVVKLAQDAERLVLSSGDMRRLPPESFEAELVRRCAITDASLKKQLRGSDVWRSA